MTSLSASIGTPRYFIVSTRKLAIMTFFTFGGYWLFCFHRHWVHVNKVDGKRMWPFVRALFLIFYLYPLMKRIDKDFRGVGVKWRWSPVGLFILYVLACVLIYLSQLALSEAELPTVIVSGVVGMLAGDCLLIWVITRIQIAANTCQGDLAGTANNTFTVANWLWMSLGLVVWPALVLATFVLFLLGIR